METSTPDLILVRVTVKMQGVQVGQHVYVDPAIPKIRELLIGGEGGPYLVPVDDPGAASHP